MKQIIIGGKTARRREHDGAYVINIGLVTVYIYPQKNEWSLCFRGLEGKAAAIDYGEEERLADAVSKAAEALQEVVRDMNELQYGIGWSVSSV